MKSITQEQWELEQRLIRAPPNGVLRDQPQRVVPEQEGNVRKGKGGLAYEITQQILGEIGVTPSSAKAEDLTGLLSRTAELQLLFV